MLDNVEFIMYMKFLDAEIWTKKSKIPPKMGFFPICDPQGFFFKNQALSLLCPYGSLTSCKKLEKTNERSLRYLKTDTRTDGHTDHGGD